MKDVGISALIRTIHAAALDANAWEEVTRELGKRLRAPVVALYAPLLLSGHAESMKTMQGMDDHVVNDYLNYYATRSPTFDALRHFPVGQVFSDRMLPDYRAYQRSEAYNDFFRPQVGEHILNLLLHRDTRQQISLSLRRGVKAGDFNEREIALLQQLAPHLAHAVRVARRLHSKDLRLQTLAESSSRAAAGGILLINHQGRLTFCNQAAQRILASEDGLSLDRRGMPCAAQTHENRKLHAAIRGAMAAAPSPSSLLHEILLVSRPSAARAYQITVTPVADEDPFLLPRMSVLVSIFDPGAEPESHAQSMQQLYGLTDAECRFVHAFVAEASVGRAAQRLSLTKSTGRTYLKRVFQKTGTSSQAELMKLILLSARV